MTRVVPWRTKPHYSMSLIFISIDLQLLSGSSALSFARTSSSGTLESDGYIISVLMTFIRTPHPPHAAYTAQCPRFAPVGRQSNPYSSDLPPSTFFLWTMRTGKIISTDSFRSGLWPMECPRLWKAQTFALRLRCTRRWASTRLDVGLSCSTSCLHAQRVFETHRWHIQVPGYHAHSTLQEKAAATRARIAALEHLLRRDLSRVWNVPTSQVVTTMHGDRTQSQT